MVKGVNKSIIEINDTGSEIFEKIVFYVSPKYGNISAKNLLKETDKFTFNFERKSGRGYKSLRRRMLIKQRLLVSGIALCGVLVTSGILYLIFS